MPLWIKYAKEAAILSQPFTNTLYLFAYFSWWPLPLPSMYCVLHAHIRPCAPLPHEIAASDVQSTGELAVQNNHFLVTVRTPSKDEFDRGRVPTAVRAHFEVPLQRAVVRLIPQTPSSGGKPRTCVEGVAAVMLSDLLFLGPIRWIAPPPWLIRLVVRMLIPYIWEQYLQLLDTLGDSSNPWCKRIQADSAGMYAYLREPARINQHNSKPVQSCDSHGNDQVTSIPVVKSDSYRLPLRKRTWPRWWPLA